MGTSWSSVRMPRSCFGGPTTRLDAAPHYRPCQKRCFGGGRHRRDVKQRDLIQGVTPTVYLYTPEPLSRSTFAIRTSVPPATIVQSALAAIRAIDPYQPVAEVRTMTQRLDEQTLPQRFSALLLGAFAGVALLLAAVGIFSVLSYIVADAAAKSGSGAHLARREPTSFGWSSLKACRPRSSASLPERSQRSRRRRS